MVFQVLAGVVDVRDKRASAVLAVSQVLVHPDFCPSDFDNDIALLKLSTRAELNRVVRPVCLPPPPQVRKVEGGDSMTPPNITCYSL